MQNVTDILDGLGGKTDLSMAETVFGQIFGKYGFIFFFFLYLYLSLNSLVQNDFGYVENFFDSTCCCSFRSYNMLVHHTILCNNERQTKVKEFDYSNFFGIILLLLIWFSFCFLVLSKWVEKNE